MSHVTPHREITMPAGTTRALEFATTYSDSWSEEDKRGEPIDAADVASARFLLKKNLSDEDEDAAVEKETAAGVEVEDGKVTVTLDPDDTKDLQGSYYGTLRLFMAGGAVVDWQDSRFADVPYLELQVTQGAVEATS